mgnify:CR=1 FL=1
MIHAKLFGKTSDGREVRAFTLKDGQNEAVILNLGGIIQSLRVAAKNGNMVAVFHGYNVAPGQEKHCVLRG